MEKVAKVRVFARVSPNHKLRIVKAFKKTGNIVAMTGDGVNDAPAIKEADIGVAMGISGTDVTKEAAAMVLIDDNFATIVSAVEEGRIIYDNIRKFIRYLLSCNLGEVLTMFLASLFYLPNPLTPIQILFVNLATDGLPAIALGVDPADKDIMRQQPREKDESIFARGLWEKIVVRGCLIGVCTLLSFMVGRFYMLDLATCRTIALCTLVMSQLFHVFECRSERHSIFEIKLFTNPYLVGAVLISIFTSDGQIVELAYNALKIACLSYFAVGLNLNNLVYYQAIEIPKYSNLSCILRSVVYLPICLFVLGRFFGVNGIWVSAIISETLTFITIKIVGNIKLHTYRVIEAN